jgi:hypothetical protein
MPFPVNLSPSPFRDAFSELLFEGKVIFAGGQTTTQHGACSANSSISGRYSDGDDGLARIEPLPIQDRIDGMFGSDWSRIRTAHEHVIGWTLSRHDETLEYVTSLLRAARHAHSSLVEAEQIRKRERKNDRRSPSAASSVPADAAGTSLLLPLDATVWSPLEVIKWLDEDDDSGISRDYDNGRLGVIVLHYVVTQLCEIVQALEEVSGRRKMQSTNACGGSFSSAKAGSNNDSGGSRSSTSSLTSRSTTTVVAATMATTFYPNGMLDEEGRRTLQMLLSGTRVVDPFVQRTCHH